MPVMVRSSTVLAKIEARNLLLMDNSVEKPTTDAARISDAIFTQ